MATKAAIICTVERLASYDTKDSVCFGMNITPALTEAGSLPKELLQPWLWKQITKASIALYAGDKKPVVKQLEVIAYTQDRSTVDKVAEKLAARFGKFKSNDNFVWNDSAPKEFDDSAPIPNSDPTEKLKWHQILAHASTYPAPVAGLLNLSCVMKLAGISKDEFAIFDALAIAPEISFTIAASNIDVTMVPANPPDKAAESKWAYSGAPGGPYLDEVSAYQEIFDLKKVAKIGLFDSNSLWFTKGQGIDDTENTNWQSRLENLLANKFNLAQLLLEASSPRPDKDVASERSEIQAAIICSINDLVGSSHLLGPAKLSFAALLLNQLSVKLSGAEIKSIEDDLKAYQNTLNLDGLKKSWAISLAKPGCAAAVPKALENSIDENEWRQAMGDLLSTFSDEQVQKRLLFETWDSALTANAAWAKCKDEVQNRILNYDSQELPAIKLSAGLYSSLLGVFWSRITAKPAKPIAGNGKKELRNSIQESLMTYYLGRFQLGDAEQNTLAADFRPQLKMSQNFKQISDGLKTLLERIALELVPEEKATQAPTKMPEGLSFQLGTFQNDDNSEALARSLAGVGVLMRRKSTGWFGLNIAKVKAEKVTLTEVSSVPLRLSFQNDFCKTIFTYDGHPLVARSHAADLQNRYQVAEQDDSASGSDIAFVYEPADDAEWGKNPALIFGEEYEFALYGITNTGAMPTILSDGHPSVLAAKPPVLETVPNDSRRSVTYLRTTSVGMPRFQASADERAAMRADGGSSPAALGQMDDKALTKYPQQVVPLANDLGLKDNPLILLWNQNPVFKFAVSAPATDIYSWDRFVAIDSAMKDTRVCVWADVHRLMNTAKEDDAPDVHIQDPSVETLRFSMKRIYPSAAGPFEHDFDCKTTPWKRPDGTKDFPAGVGMTAVKGPAAEVTLNMLELDPEKAPASPIAVDAAGVIQINTRKGEVWELSVGSLVRKAARARFAAFSKDFQPFDTPDAAGDFLVSPLRFIIEAATEAMPSREDLYESLTVKPDAHGAAVVIDPSKATSSTGFPYVKAVEMKRQCWRWDGLEAEDYPFGKSPLDPNSKSRVATEAMKWEAETFYNRGKDDSSRHFKAVNLAVLPDKTGKTAAAPEAEIFHENTDNDRRAMHFRYSVIATSRYDGLPGLATAPVQSQLLLEPPDPKKLPKQFTIWKRFYSPYSGGTEPIARPAVKFILPLTESRGSSVPATGFLAICSEEWYQVGGLGERLVMEICKTDGSESDPKNDPILLEAGADPILTGEANPIRGAKDQAAGAGSNYLMGTPLGCTFDSDTDAPLFVNTAVYFNAPTLLGGEDGKTAVTDATWNFVKVQFKRLVLKDSFAGATDLESELTAPTWIQLLQQASLFAEKDDIRHRVSDLTFSVSANGGGKPTGNFVKDRKAVVLAPTESEADLFSLWILVTRIVSDAFGRKDNESFVTVLPYPLDGNSEKILKQMGAEDYTFRGRVVELQRSPNVKPMSTKDFFKLIFIADNNYDATARIVRVSEPFEILFQ